MLRSTRSEMNVELRGYAECRALTVPLHDEVRYLGLGRGIEMTIDQAHLQLDRLRHAMQFERPLHGVMIRGHGHDRGLS